MANKKYAEYSETWLEKYKEFLKLDTIVANTIVRQIEEIAQRTGKIEWKLRAEYFKLELFGRNWKQYENELHFAKELLNKSFTLLEIIKKANMPELELMLRQKIIDYHWLYFKNYEAAFEQYTIQDELLQKISSKDVPEKAFYYIYIANAHYYFKDYPKSIFYYSKILEEKETATNQPSQQHARNGLGLCYRDAYHDFDTSDHYFNAIMQVNYLSPENERERDKEIWDGIAEGNIGNNMFMREEYDKAIPLLKSSIEKMLKYDDYAFASDPVKGFNKGIAAGW